MNESNFNKDSASKINNDILFNKIAYAKTEEDVNYYKQQLPENIELVIDSSQFSETRGNANKSVVFKDEENKDIIFANAGTRLNQGKNKAFYDLSDDVRIAFKNTPNKLEQTSNLNQRVLDDLGDKASEYKFHYTGHSLGGAMAELSAADMYNKLSKKGEIEQSSNLETSEAKISTTSFDNPGSKPIVEKVLSKQNNSLDKFKQSGNFVTFNSDNNIINTKNEQLGNTYISVHDYSEKQTKEVKSSKKRKKSAKVAPAENIGQNNEKNTNPTSAEGSQSPRKEGAEKKRDSSKFKNLKSKTSQYLKNKSYSFKPKTQIRTHSFKNFQKNFAEADPKIVQLSNWSTKGKQKIDYDEGLFSAIKSVKEESGPKPTTRQWLKMEKKSADNEIETLRFDTKELSQALDKVENKQITFPASKKPEEIEKGSSSEFTVTNPMHEEKSSDPGIKSTASSSSIEAPQNENPKHRREASTESSVDNPLNIAKMGETKAKSSQELETLEFDKNLYKAINFVKNKSEKKETETPEYQMEKSNKDGSKELVKFNSKQLNEAKQLSKIKQEFSKAPEQTSAKAKGSGKGASLYNSKNQRRENRL